MDDGQVLGQSPTDVYVRAVVKDQGDVATCRDVVSLAEVEGLVVAVVDDSALGVTLHPVRPVALQLDSFIECDVTTLDVTNFAVTKRFDDIPKINK